MGALGRLLGASWASLGRSWALLGRLLGARRPLLVGLGRLLGASWLLETSPTSILEASGTNFEGPRALMLEDLATILSKRCFSHESP